MEELQEKFPNDSIFAGRFLMLDLNSSIYAQEKKSFQWDIEDTTPSRYKVEIGNMRETTQMDNERYRWIPNTGEYLELRDINVYIRNKTGVDVTNGNINIEFAGLNDRDYNIDTSGTNGNIYKNKAEKFMVKLYGNGQEAGVAENSVTRNTEGFYEYTENKTITVNQQGVLMDGTNPLVVAVRPESAAKAYPGDDFILRFNLLDNSGNILRAINCDEKDYVAVYDKKMLWRANLYIKEGTVTNENNQEVSVDWNDMHPWNVPASGSTSSLTWWDKGTDANGAEIAANVKWGNNEWNKDEKGGQITITSCTYWDGNKKIENSVAYGWGCRDALFEYNNYLKTESDLIKQKRDELNASQQSNQTSATGTSFNSLIWNESTSSTYAPSDKWENYLFTKRTKKSKKNDKGQTVFYYQYGTSTATDTQHKYYIDGQTYVPGLSTYWAYGPVSEVYDASQATNHYSIGTDCSGLVESAIDYGSFYKANSTTNKSYTDAGGNKLGCSGLKGSSFKIRAAGSWSLENDKSSNEEKNEERKMLSHAVPGDIFVKTGTGSHVVIIQNLNYSGEGFKIKDLSDIDIIQAGKGENADWQVMKGDFKTAKYGDHPLNTFELRRLNVK